MGWGEKTASHLIYVRRPNLPRFERICTICSNEVEDEIHFILRCPALVNARRPLLDKCFELHEDFQTCTDRRTIIMIILFE